MAPTAVVTTWISLGIFQDTECKDTAEPNHLFHPGRPCTRCALAMSYDLLVAKWDSVQPHHVRQAAAEYDQLDRMSSSPATASAAPKPICYASTTRATTPRPFSASHTATRPDAHSVPTTSAQAYTVRLAC